MASSTVSLEAIRPSERRRIFLNAFDMFTVGHLSFGQWRRPNDRSKDKRRDLTYWTDLAQLLEKGDINALFLADTYGQYDVYKKSSDPTLITGAQFPMGDPIIPISAMAAVTKNLGFAVTVSTTYEAPYTLARRLSTLDHLTKGRIGWNIVTSFKESGAKAIGIKQTEHDKRYEVADEYLRVLYKLWEGSWADDALVEDVVNEVYSNPERIKFVNHHGQYFNVEAPHILDPSPQRTPFLFQAGTSSAGIKFGATHSEGIFVSALSPQILAPRVKALRAKAAEVGRDPRSLKIFATLTPVIGKTHEEAEAKYQEALKYASYEGGLAFWSGNAGIDLGAYDPDEEISESNTTTDHRVQSLVSNLAYRGTDLPKWTPRNIGKQISIGGNGPVPVGTAEEVADELERWIDVADLDGFNIGYITNPGTFEEVVELLVPELRKRGRYSPENESGTMRERIYGKGQSRLRSDHPGQSYRFELYDGQ